MTDAEGVADLLRVLGDLTSEEVAQRGGSEAMLAALEQARRVIKVRMAGAERWVAVEDAARLRDALGVPASKVPSNIARYGNTSGATIPILVDELNERFEAVGDQWAAEHRQQAEAHGSIV